MQTRDVIRKLLPGALGLLCAAAASWACAASSTYLYRIPVVGLRASTTVSTPTDPYWSSVTMLASFDGVSGATTFSDAKGHVLSAMGSPVLSSTKSPYGTGTAVQLNGSSAVTTPGNSGYAFSGDFTVEMWAYVTAHPTYGGLLSYDTLASCGAHTGWQIIFDQTSNNLRLETVSAIPLLVSTAALPLGAWNHIAVVRHGTGTNNVTFYINGSPAGSATDNATWNGGSNPLLMGVERCEGGYTTGYLGDVRITNGVARYTGAFTPPTADFPTR
jgi:hypothetical protein